MQTIKITLHLSCEYFIVHMLQLAGTAFKWVYSICHVLLWGATKFVPIKFRFFKIKIFWTVLWRRKIKFQLQPSRSINAHWNLYNNIGM